MGVTQFKRKLLVVCQLNTDDVDEADDRITAHVEGQLAYDVAFWVWEDKWFGAAHLPDEQLLDGMGVQIMSAKHAQSLFDGIEDFLQTKEKSNEITTE